MVRRWSPVCFVSLRAWYDASFVAIRWRCVFRHEDICSVLVSKIVFLQELDPGVCGGSVDGVVDVPLGGLGVRRPEGRGAGQGDALGATRWDRENC